MYYSPEDLAAEHTLLAESQGDSEMPSPEEEEVGKLGQELAEDEPRPERKLRQKHREPDPEVAPDEVVEEVEVPAPVTAPPTKPVHAAVGVSAPEVDVKKIVEDSAGASGYTVMLALIAVVGGGAGWKFYQNYAKQKHEQAMKALEIEQARVDKQQNDHQACSAKNAALAAQLEGVNAKVSALESKASALETKVSSIPEGPPDLGFSPKDFEKLDKRMKAVEKKLQAPKSNP